MSGRGPLRPDSERDLREEIRFHLEERARELEAAGLPPDEAARRARAAFGDPEEVVARVRRQSGGGGLGRGRRLLTDLGQDAAFALRVFSRSPGFALVATLTLALGLGANTAIFSIADAVFLRSPPVADPAGLVAVYTTCRAGDPRCSSSYPDYLDYRDRSDLLADLAGYSWAPAVLGEGDGGAELLNAMAVTGNYFELLGAAPAAGRLLREDDDAPGDPRAVAVLTWDAWQRLFGGDAGVVGRSVRLSSVPFEVVGVAPRGFRGTGLTHAPDLFLPITAAGLLGVGSVAREGIFEDRGSRWIDGLVGRLRPGASAAALGEELRALALALNELHPDERGSRTVTVDRAHRYTLPQFGAEGLTRFLAVLVAVVAATLLLACANLANLLLSRAAGREREMGVRLSLGAGRCRVTRQLLTEAATLALVGGVAALAVARLLLAALSRYAWPGGVSLDGLQVDLDGRVLAFTFALALATALLFGMAPALHAARTDLAGAMKAGRARGGRGARLRSGLVAVQVGLCLVLLTGGGLFLRSLRHGLAYDPGFRPEGVALARLDPSALRLQPAEGVALVDAALERVRRLPGVVDASASAALPLGVGGYMGFFADVPGYEPAPDEEMRVEVTLATPGILRVLGTELIEGRGVGEDDRGAPVALVNREMARRYWAGESAVGRPVRVAGLELTVAGVIEDLAWRTLPQEPINVLVAPLSLVPEQTVDGPLWLAVRTEGDARALLPALRREVGALAPGLPVSSLHTLDDHVAVALTAQRLGTTLLAAFALLALVLSAVGIAGVVAYTVARGRRDIGIRLALGASPGSVLRGVAGRMAGPVLLGLAGGIVGSLLLGGALSAFLLGVSPADPATLLAVALLLLAVASGAALVPARRAAGVDPVEALRTE